MKYEIQQVLMNRKWIRSSYPFPHFRANNVFNHDFYHLLEREFFKSLSSNEDGNDVTSFSRNMKGYDAKSCPLPTDDQGPLSIFVTKEWHNILASLCSVESVGDLSAGLHHHQIGSKNGKIHTDLCPGWFVDMHNESGINLANSRICNYYNGCVANKGYVPREMIRSVAMIYFLANEQWYPGDGGETGFYSFSDSEVESFSLAIPPINNSILVFECTPFSLHSFITNRNKARNSVIMWLHCSKDYVVKKWGESYITKWPKQYE